MCAQASNDVLNVFDVFDGEHDAGYALRPIRLLQSVELALATENGCPAIRSISASALSSDGGI
jgi:hypothetical protein